MVEAFNREQAIEIVAGSLDEIVGVHAVMHQPHAEAIVDAILALPHPEEIYCCTMDHENVPAVRYMSCEKDGSYPYCGDCAGILLRGGFEVDRGPVSPLPVPQEDVTDELVHRVLTEFYGGDEHHQIEIDGMRAALVAALSREPGSSK